MEPLKLACPHCSNAVVLPEELAFRPSPGQFTICMACKAPYVLKEDMTGRPLTQSEDEIFPLVQIFELLRLRSIMKNLERTEQRHKEQLQKIHPMFNRKFSQN